MKKQKHGRLIERLPSGNYRLLVDLGKDENGKRIRKSVTASTESDVLRLAQEVKENYKKPYMDYTVKEALDTYIQSMENIRAESTLYGYRSKANTRLRSLHNIKISELTLMDIRRAVNNDAAQGIGHKTLHDAYALIYAAAYALGVNLPPIKRIPFPPEEVEIERKLPTMEETIRIIMDSSVYLPCLLALECGGLRISEVRGIKYSDIKLEGEVHFIQIHAPRVCVNGKDVVKKTTKTKGSTRRLQLPEYLYQEIQRKPHDSEDEYIINESYRAISGRFKRLMKKNGYNIRFHDLRAIFATELKMLSVPKDVIMCQGGWTNSKVLDRVYTVISDEMIIEKMSTYHETIHAYLKNSSLEINQ